MVEIMALVLCMAICEFAELCRYLADVMSCGVSFTPTNYRAFQTGAGLMLSIGGHYFPFSNEEVIIPILRNISLAMETVYNIDGRNFPYKFYFGQPYALI